MNPAAIVPAGSLPHRQGSVRSSRLEVCLHTGGRTIRGTRPVCRCAFGCEEAGSVSHAERRTPSTSLPPHSVSRTEVCLHTLAPVYLYTVTWLTLCGGMPLHDPITVCLHTPVPSHAATRLCRYASTHGIRVSRYRGTLGAITRNCRSGVWPEDVVRALAGLAAHPTG